MDFATSEVMPSGAVPAVGSEDSPMSSQEPTVGEASASASPADGVASSTPETASSQRTADGLHKHSCVVCATRKIKCDRKDPCGNCVRAKSNCIFRNPAPPRRRKKGAAQSEVLERLKRAEELLAIRSDSATDPSPLNNIMFRMADIHLENRGQLINTNDSSRYLDNTMWIFLNEELKDIRSELEEEPEGDTTLVAGQNSELTEDDLFAATVFGASPRSMALTSSHPTSVQILQIWQLYLLNVHPVAKITHAPSTQQLVIDAVGHLDSIPRSLEAFMFCMYFLVIKTTKEKECEEMFHESKRSLILRYRGAAQAALLRADYLASYSFQTLQAYMLYLLGCRGSVEPAALWALSGIAVRMAHRQGLHRDADTLGLPIFETEMRRRLWWEIVFFDSRTAMLSGTGGVAMSRGAEFKPPRNVNDGDLFPGMTNAPTEHEGLTEMVFSMIRAEVGNFLISFPRTGTLDGSWQGITHSTIPIPDKDKLIDELEGRLQSKFLSKLDPLIPVHLLARCIAISASTTIRFMAHVKSSAIGPQEEQLLFDCACAIMENTLFIISEPSLSRFSWSTRMHFQYLALIWLLRSLRKHTRDAKCERGWQILYRLYSLTPSLIREAPHTLQAAVGDLTLSAWDARVAANPGLTEPDFIQSLAKLRGRRTVSNDQAVIGGEFTPGAIPITAPGNFTEGMSTEATNSAFARPVADQLAFDDLDWENWGSLMEGGEHDAFGIPWPTTGSATAEQPARNEHMDVSVPADFYLR